MKVFVYIANLVVGVLLGGINAALAMGLVYIYSRWFGVSDLNTGFQVGLWGGLSMLGGIRYCLDHPVFVDKS